MSRKRQPKIFSKSRNRGRTISFLVHLVLLLVAFLPFLSMQIPTEPTKEALVIQFDYPFNQYVKPEKFVVEPPPPPQETPFVSEVDPGSKMSGSEAGGNQTKAEPMKSRPVEAAPSRLAAPQLNSVTKTSSALLSSSASDIPLPAPKISSPSKWQSVSDNSFEADAVEELNIIDFSDGSGKNEVGGSEPGDDDSDITSEGFGTKPGGAGGTGTGTGNTTGAGSGPGGGKGVGSAGKNTGVGNDGTGVGWQVGIGKEFGRQFVSRGNVGSIAVKEGRITVSICVDRSGKVVRTKYNPLGSSIREPDIIRKAEAVAANYVFVEDPTAPVEQCGNLTFIFKIK
ncbi:MAG TPA: hypothetical protein VFG10_04320 [Saprospiraceae bacterium]|nr:hypothetical protein [Saprospiraceae bacterium]